MQEHHITTPAQTQPKTEHRSLSDVLAPFDPGYVRVRAPGSTYQVKDRSTGRWVDREATGKEPIGRGWQDNPITARAAGRHARAGGNVGLLGGAGGLILLDIDAGRDAKLSLWPELAQTIEVCRDTAPDRAKFIVHIDGALPPSAKDHTAGLEILSAGSQGVIYGRHHTGAKIQHRGDQIITATAERVMQFWHDCGCSAHDADAAAVAGAPDAAAVAASVALAETVLAMAGVAGNADGWQPYKETGRKIVLDSCPFNPKADPHAEDAAAAVLILPDGKIGATCHHARCQERIRAYEGGGWALLKDVAGYIAPERPPHLDPLFVPALYDVIRHLDPEDWTIGATAATWRNMTAAAMGIVKIGQLAGKFTDLSLGVRRVAEKSGLSRSVAARAVAGLSGWFIQPVLTEETDADPTLAKRWDIHPSILAAAAEACFKMGHVSTEGVENNHVSQFETSTLRPDYMATDAFIRRQQPITESELAEKIAARAAEIAAAVRERIAVAPDTLPGPLQMVVAAIEARDDLTPAAKIRAISQAVEETPLPDAPGEDTIPFPKPIQRRRYIRRLRATVASPGPAVLVLMDMLDAEGPMTRSDLAAAVHISRTSCWRAVVAGVTAGCLEIVDGYVCLAEGWRAHIDAETPKMPTAGIVMERRIDNLGARIAYLEWKERTAADDTERVRLKRAIAQVAKERHVLMAVHAGREVAPEVAGGKLTDARFYVDRLAAIHDLDPIRGLAKQLTGIPRDQAMRWAVAAGWTAREAAQAWAYSRVMA